MEERGVSSFFMVLCGIFALCDPEKTNTAGQHYSYCIIPPGGSISLISIPRY